MRHLHHRHAGTTPVDELSLSLLQHLFGQYGWACTEIENRHNVFSND
jgi:hypothetical protein